MFTTDVGFMGYSLYAICCFFVLYSFFGWGFESTVVSIDQKKLVNRGFLNGPVCPIYAVGGLSVYFALMPVKNNIFFVYFGGLVVATVIEYIIGWLLEVIFHTSWWDYSEEKFQINGRICLKSSLAWGLLSVAMMYIIQPLIETITYAIPIEIGQVCLAIIAVVFLLDIVLTIASIINLNDKLKRLSAAKNEIYEYLKSIQQIEFAKELRERLENGMDLFEDKLESLKKQLDVKLGDIEILETVGQSYKKLNELFLKYKGQVNLKSLIQKRFFDSYPKIKSIKLNDYLNELKKILKNK